MNVLERGFEHWWISVNPNGNSPMTPLYKNPSDAKTAHKGILKEYPQAKIWGGGGAH